jgi:AcrR family transcriptional regulator
LTEDWGRFNRLIFGEIAHELPDLFRLWVREGLMEIWNLLEKIIRRGQAAGEFRKDADAKAAARFIYSGLSHQVLLHEHMGIGKVDKISTRQILEGSLDLVIRGLAAGVKEGRKS